MKQTIDNTEVMIDIPSTSVRDEKLINQKLLVLPTDLKPFPKVTASNQNRKFQRKKKNQKFRQTPQF